MVPSFVRKDQASLHARLPNLDRPKSGGIVGAAARCLNAGHRSVWIVFVLLFCPAFFASQPRPLAKNAGRKMDAGDWSEFAGRLIPHVAFDASFNPEPTVMAQSLRYGAVAVGSGLNEISNVPDELPAP